jgi:hypothetical protein
VSEFPHTSEQLPSSLLVPSGEDRHGEQRGLGISRIDFKSRWSKNAGAGAAGPGGAVRRVVGRR